MRYEFAVDSAPSLGPVNYQVEEKERVDSSAVADRATALAGAGEVNPLSTIEAAEIGDKAAITTAKQRLTQPSTQLVEQSLRDGVSSVEDLQYAYENTTEKEAVEAELLDFFIEQGILVEGIEYTPSDVRYTTNMLIAEHVFRDAISDIEDNTGFWGKVGDFTDRYLIRQFPIGALEDVSRKTERMGEELLQAAVTMGPKEYTAFINNYLQEKKEEGVFTSENIFAILNGLEEATSAGVSPHADTDQMFAILDLIPFAGAAVKGIGRLGKFKTLERADHAITRVTALEGQEAGAVVAEKIIKTTEGLDNVAKTKAGPAAFDEGPSTVRPSSAKVIEIAENNNIWRDIRELDTGGTFGRVYRPDQLKAAGAVIVENFAKRTNNTINNYTFVNDIANNPVARVDFGNVKTGAAYKREQDAVKALGRQDLPEAYIAPVDPNDTAKGYVIRVDNRIDTTSLADPFDVNAVEYGAIRETFAKVFGSNAALDEDYLSALAAQGEAGLSLVKSHVAKYEKALKTLPSDSKIAVSRVLKELRDGKDAEIKTGYTVGEFKDKFTELHPKGLSPTKADMEAYNAVVEFEDAGWLMRANETLNRFVKKGYWQIETKHENLIGKKVNEVPEGAKVLNGHTGYVITDVSKVKTGFWKLDRPTAEGIEYVTAPQKVNILDHADVMGFNSGGRRINPKANYFVAFDDTRPRAFLTAFSEKQAKVAVDQFNAIGNKVRELGGDLRKVASNEELDALVRANNDWNPSITSFNEFAQLAIRKNWNLNAKVSYKERGGELVGEALDSPYAGFSWDDYVKVDLNRSNDVLMDFGGGEAANMDPVSAIMQEFSNSATHYTHRAYTYNAAASWVKRAQQQGSGIRLSAHYAPTDYLNQVQHSEVVGTSATARKLKTQQGIIRRRLKMKGPIERGYDRFGQNVIESVFDKTGFKLNSIDPTNTLLGVGFQSAFGFMNISQFFMQSAHVSTVVALSPTQGFRGAAAVIPLRLALMSGTPAAEKLAIKRLAKYMGETEETMAELVAYTRTSGRDVIGGETMELGTGTSFGISNWGGESQLPSAVRDALSKATSGGRKVLDAGLMPFNQGERLGRMTGINTAFFEFKKKFPNVSALSDEGRRWITNREQTLTFNMTASSRPMFQSGLMKVPTQWLSYSFRALESVVVGRGLTPAERTRLAAVLAPMYGLTGMGLASFAEYASETFGVDDPELFIGLKYGLIDYLIAEMTPVETSVATRLAPITAFTDLYEKIIGGEGTALEIVGGPSGQIASGIFTQFAKALTSLYNGHTVSLTEDTLMVLRQPSGLNNIAVGVGILNNGFYRSKTGSILPIEMKTSDALVAFLGFSPLEVAEFYSQKSGKFNSDKLVRDFSKNMRSDFQRAMQIFREDEQRGLKMLSEIEIKIANSGFTPGKQMEIRQGLKDVDSSFLYELIVDLFERDRTNAALAVEQLLGGN